MAKAPFFTPKTPFRHPEASEESQKYTAEIDPVQESFFGPF
jgi:hypothetical protein